MKRIETRENEFVVQFRELLKSSFPLVLEFKVDYFIGEDKGETKLCFTLTSKFGRIYTKLEKIEPYQTIYDVEEGFMDKVINDLMLTGVTFMNVKAFESIDPARVNKEVRAEKFDHSAPRRLLYIN